MKISTLFTFALALCLLLMIDTQAHAFGKNGKGLFGWRGPQSGSSCGSSCGASCGGSQGQSCASTCANGQCGPQSTSGFNFAGAQQSSEMVCINGVCYPKASFQSQAKNDLFATAAAPEFPPNPKIGDRVTFEFAADPAWSTPAWKRVK